MQGTKFWLAVGVEVALLLVLLMIILMGKFDGGIFTVWLGAFVGVPLQYGITNVVASGQAAKSPNGNSTAGIPGS